MSAVRDQLHDIRGGATRRGWRRRAQTLRPEKQVRPREVKWSGTVYRVLQPLLGRLVSGCFWHFGGFVPTFSGQEPGWDFHGVP